MSYNYDECKMVEYKGFARTIHLDSSVWCSKCERFIEDCVCRENYLEERLSEYNREYEKEGV